MPVPSVRQLKQKSPPPGRRHSEQSEMTGQKSQEALRHIQEHQQQEEAEEEESAQRSVSPVSARFLMFVQLYI